MVFTLPVAFEFAEDSDTGKASLEDRIKALQDSDKELFSAVFGRGIKKGKDTVTEAHLKTAMDEHTEKLLGALKTERINRVLRERANAMGFFNPDNVVDLLGSKLSLNDELEVVDAEGNTASIDEAISKFAKENTHMVKSNQRPGLGTSKPASTDEGVSEKKVYKRSELRDAAFYKANEADIMNAAREGRIIDDL